MSQLVGTLDLSTLPGGAGEASSRPVTVLRPRRGLAAVGLAELWRCRELWWVLALRDLQVRYKQTAIGAAWAVLQPLAMMVVATVVMGHLLGLSSKVHGSYAVFVYAGMVPWTLFAASVTAAGNSLVANAEILKKVYFPRLILSLSAVGAPVVDALAALLVLVGLMLVMGLAFSPTLLLLPLLLGSVVIAAVAVGLLLSALTVRYRDFRIVVPFTLQLWFFVTPVIYPLPVGQRWKWLLAVNPMDGPIEAFRAMILGQPIDFGIWGLSLGVALLLGAVGLWYFVRTERQFADVV